MVFSTMATAAGLEERILKFNNGRKIGEGQIPEKKLFILIPSSSFVFGTIKGYHDCSKKKDLIIKNEEEKFPEHKTDRVLIRGRSYKTPVYYVNYNNNRYYFLLTDTPLKTFYETFREQKALRDVKEEVISSFYYTLERLIEETPEMKDIVKLIFYDDENKNLKVPDVVKNRILKKIMKTRSKKKKYKDDEVKPSEEETKLAL